MNRARNDVTRNLIRYGFALALSAAALLVRLAFNPVVGHQMPYFLFWLATAVALWRVGIGPAVFTAITGAIVGDYYFVEPLHTVLARPVELAFVFEYLFVCAITCLLGGLARRVNARIQAATVTALEQKERAEREITERKRSEAVLRGILDSAPVGIWMLNNEGYITATNAASDRIWGMNRPHGIYHINRCTGWRPDTRQQLTPSDWPAARALDQGQAVLDHEIEIEAFDGTRKYALISAVPLRDERGIVTEAISVFVDISRRKQAEAELERQRARIGLLHEAAAQLLSTTGTEEQIRQIYKKVGGFFGADIFLEYATEASSTNRQLVVSGGISSDTEFRLKHLPFAEAYCHTIPEQKKAVRACNVQQSDDPSLQIMKTAGVRAYTCHPLLVGERLLGTLAFASRKKDAFDPADEDVFQTLAHYVAIARDRWRLNASLEAYTHDLEKAVQERTASLEESSARLRGIIETAVDAIITFSDRGELETVNPAAERMFGYSRDELLGKDVKSFLDEPSRLRVGPDFDRHLTTRAGDILGVTHDLTAVRKSGQTFPIQLTLSEGRLPNKRFFTCIVRDVTEHKKAEERLRERSDELEQLSYSIIHDMRAPLRAMRSFGQMLQEDSAHVLDATAQDYIRRIIESSQRMDQLITDVFNFTSLMREGLTLTRLNPKPLLMGIIESYPDLDPGHADIHVADAFPDVLANRGGLTQCFSNLLSNAVKFAKPGQKPVIKVWSEHRDPMIRLWFEDEGIGIDPRHQDRIFEMFQKLDTESGGTGIGLALLRKAVEKMHGHVGVESERGKGSRFWIELQAAEVPAPQLQAT